ncbi:uncharacterized protein LOC112594729 isoform X2 [Melanaphis sacchari]|uniref:uncharacterized protein LOC112594729 isoform X2 n=1 Tax=Melanaphis sacchari TaxID=742174 RepID=UPI000DC14D1E|nr:uncharacterized protein LOC112594729 isoform X2 [Melanaphis sacchari]
MNKEYIIKDSVTTLAIAIADHQQSPNENYLGTCLDKVNNVLKPQWMKNQDDILCLFQVCQEISPTDTNLVVKCCKLMSKVLPKLGFGEENLLKNTISWTLSCTFHFKSSVQYTEQIDEILNFYVCTIQTYKNLNINNNRNISDVMALLLQVLQKIENKSVELQTNVDILTYIKFLEATVVIIKDYDYINTIGIYMIKFMEQSINQKICMQSYGLEVLKYGLQILSQLIEQSKQWTNDNFNKLLPIVLLYLRYGLIFNQSKFLYDLQPSPIVQWENPSRLDIVPMINMTNKRRQKKKRIIESKNKVPKFVTISIDDEVLMNVRDSDFSEDEPCTSNLTGRITIDIRLLAAQIMKKMFTIVEKKILLGYLYTIIDGSMNIQNCLISEVGNSIREPSSKVRATIITAITSIFNGSKIFFAQAQYREKKGAFTTWSETLADYIIRIHDTLLKDFGMETLSVRLVLLHCFSTVISNTPYTRLNKSLLKSVLDAILVYTKCEPCDNYLRIGVFRCLSSVFNSELPQFEKELLLEKKTEIINLCLYLFKETKSFLESDQDSTQMIVRRQCWQMLNSYCNHYHGLIENRMLINIAIEDMKYTKQTLLRKNILSCLKQMSAVSEGDDYKSARLEKWKLIFRKLIPQMFAEKDPHTLPILIESLSTIGSDLFNNLEDELIDLYCNELHMFVTYEDYNIQSAAIATLGTLIKYEKLSKNPMYIRHTIDDLLYISSINKLNSIQEKVAWTLNCVSEILVENWDLYEIEDGKLLCLAKAALSTLDRKPCRACGSRALGLLLSLIDHTDITGQQFGPIYEDSINILINIANGNDSMKNRWNSCNSLGVLYQTNSIQKLPETLRINIFNTLSTLIINCCNFKVRHVACSSLMYNRRDLYGNNYSKMWHRLFDAFENSQNLPHICEYKHQQKLINQLCALFCNLCNLLELSDIGGLTYLFDSRLHVIQNEMEKFCNFNDIPNYSEMLAATHNHLHNMLKTKQLTSKQEEIINNLLNVFVNH